MKDPLSEAIKMVAIKFHTYIDDNGWIRDPFPRKGFEDNKLRYSNIAMIGIDSDEQLKFFTIDELYEMFIESEQKRLNELKVLK